MWRGEAGLSGRWAQPGSEAQSWARHQASLLPQGEAQTVEDMGQLAVYLACAPTSPARRSPSTAASPCECRHAPARRHHRQPASGRDVRRLTANAGLYSSTDKAAVVQRLLGAFGATGVDEVLMPPDMTIAAAVLKASASRHAHDSRWPRLEFLDLPLRRAWKTPATPRA